MENIEPKPRNPNIGGAREGAGRPRLEATKFREALVKKAEENAEALADAWIKKALSGETQALEKLGDRVMGKVTDNLNIKADIQIVLDV